MAKPRIRMTWVDGKQVPANAASAARAHYEGGSTGPRIRRNSMMTGPNTPVTGNLSRLQARSYSLIRNNAYAEGAQESYVSNLVGSGIRPKWGDQALQQLWDDWALQADADGGGFYALQALAAAAQFGAGEVFARYRYRRLTDGLPVPMQLQLLESAHLDPTFSRVLPGARFINMGIEFDGIGRRRLYHFWRFHPHEKLTTQFNSRVPVRAPEVVHVYRKTRPGQLRGVPELTSVILRLHEIDAMQDAMLARQKFAQLFGAFVEKPADSNLGANDFFGSQMTEDGEDLTEFVPGAIHYLENGEKVVFSDPPGIGSSYDSWLKSELRAVAKGAGITYEQMTGDLASVNYSSIRAGLVEFRRRIEALQAHLIVSQLCRPVAAKWLDLAVAMGSISIPNYEAQRRDLLAIDWIAPRWEWVDPLKETQADILEIRAGLVPRAEKAAERGYALEDLDRAIEESNQSADDHGLVLDSDPRRTARTGVAVAQTLADLDDEGPADDTAPPLPAEDDDNEEDENS